MGGVRVISESLGEMYATPGERERREGGREGERGKEGERERFGLVYSL
jgi:hypothetical protein